MATPNQSAFRPMTMSGAMAMIGIVWLATMIGTSGPFQEPDVHQQDRERETQERSEGEPDRGVAQRERAAPMSR